MNKSLFYIIVNSLLILSFIPGSRSVRANCYEIPLFGMNYDENTFLVNLDGSHQDWRGIKPLWNEVGVDGRGAFEHNIDIKQTYFMNDERYLYVFMRCTPSIIERFKISSTRDIIGNLYFDIDNNSGSGSRNVANFKSEKFKGYELRVLLLIGGDASSSSNVPAVEYQIGLIKKEESAIYWIFRQNSQNKGSLIAHGPDGIEFALPLNKLRLKAPATVRVLLAEQAHLSKDEDYSVGIIDLKAWR